MNLLLTSGTRQANNLVYYRSKNYSPRKVLKSQQQKTGATLESMNFDIRRIAW